jgi:hypothetical protein
LFARLEKQIFKIFFGMNENLSNTYSEGMILLTPAFTAASMRSLWLGTASVATAETKASCPSSAVVSESRFV